MALDYDKLMAFRLDGIAHSYTRKDAILYALGVGLGADPLDRTQLRYVYEENLQVLPSFGGILAYPGFWIKDHPEFGIDWKQLLNGEQGIELHGALPPEGEVVGSLRVEAVVDKGAGKGATVHTVRDVKDKASGKLLCTVTNTVFCRADGGFGGPGSKPGVPAPKPPGRPLPERAPDLVSDTPILPQAALIYRLSGDYNPLHADPDVAATAGFKQPILHGAATWAIAAYQLLGSLCDGEAGRFKGFDVRFTSPVYPGETVRVEIWNTADGEAGFRASVPARGVTVLDRGWFTYGPKEG